MLMMKTRQVKVSKSQRWCRSQNLFSKLELNLLSVYEYLRRASSAQATRSDHAHSTIQLLGHSKGPQTGQTHPCLQISALCHSTRGRQESRPSQYQVKLLWTRSLLFTSQIVSVRGKCYQYPLSAHATQRLSI